MATAEQVAELREMIAEPTSTKYSDESLEVLIDDSDSLEAVAAKIWRNKASALAGLTDVKEGNSDRKLSQLQDKALKQAASYEATVAQVAGTSRSSGTRRIERV